MATIRRKGKPMTFADIRATVNEDIGEARDAKLRPSFERALRRALHRLASEGVLMKIGDGGPADPLRYFFHPLGIALMCDKPEADALFEALAADSGAEAAAAKLMTKGQSPHG